MHIGNGIICPVTGLPMLAVTGVAAFYAYKKAKKDFTKDKILPTVSLTALVFGLQTINFAIPQTGSSGHIVGGVLLAALLSPSVAFLAMSLILFVQAVFFADGGILALGCNIFNMGILACYVAYPLFYKPFADNNKPFWGAIFASVIALQSGSLAVVAESVLSGSVMFSGMASFMSLMQGIHLPIGIAEGLVTAGVVWIAKTFDKKKVAYCFGVSSIVFVGLISQIASTKPDGLEWSLLNISDYVVEQTQGTIFLLTELLQQKTALFADLPYSVGSLSGLLTIVALMFLFCQNLKRETVKVDEY